MASSFSDALRLGSAAGLMYELTLLGSSVLDDAVE